MENTQKNKFREIIRKNARLLNLNIIDRKEKPFVVRNNFHIETRLENEIFEWRLQMTIDITDNDLIHMMMFLHPVIITDETRLAYIEFANSANIWLGSSFGRFWVNDDNDYCYECILPAYFIDNEKELELQLFDKPFSHFRDALSPLMKLKDGEWNSTKAIAYLNKLRTDGYVDNSEYGLW